MKLQSRWVYSIICCLLSIALTLTVAHAQGPLLSKPESMTVDRSLGNGEYSTTVDNDFRDNTLPAARPQGPKGLLYASKAFRTAVPDLHCTIEDLLVSGDKVTARLLFSGTHQGEFMGHAPT